MEKNPQKEKDFTALKSNIYIKAVDAEVDMTMEFDRGTLAIYGGKEGKPDIEIATGSSALLELANINIRFGLPYYFDKNGRAVLKMLLKGDLKIKGMLSHLPTLTRFTKIMSVA